MAGAVVSDAFMPHIVRPGEFLRHLAERFGFDAQVVWLHPSNARLRESRQDGDLLVPGDVIFVPSRATDPSQLNATQSNAFSAPTTTTTATVYARYGVEPLNGEEFHVELMVSPTGAWIKGDEKARTTGRDGAMEFRVPTQYTHVWVHFPRLRHLAWFAIGGLTHLGDEVGVRARLLNLGLYETASHRVIESSTTQEDLTKRAKDRFCNLANLDASASDEVFLARLKERHGC
jgi:hypothetical protein